MLYDNEKIKALLLKFGLSGNELARRSGISGPSMHSILTGNTKNVRAQTLVNIANALGVPLREILRGRNPKGNHSSDSEFIALFNQLDDRNKQAILIAARALASQQKK